MLAKSGMASSIMDGDFANSASIDPRKLLSESYYSGTEELCDRIIEDRIIEDLNWVIAVHPPAFPFINGYASSDMQILPMILSKNDSVILLMHLQSI